MQVLECVQMIIALILRVLSGIWTRYGAGAAQNFAVYENFPETMSGFSDI